MSKKGKRWNKMINNIMLDFFDGKWVESDKVQETFNMSFSDCVSIFDMSRTAEWWNIVGTTKDERCRNGQKITVSFRLKKKASE